MKTKLGLGLLSIFLIITIVAIILVINDKSEDKSNNQPESMDVGQYTKIEKEEYDVIVVGTDPEGVMAAISAARNGMKVLLIDGRDRDRLGGLFTLGGLNTLDLNNSPSQPSFSNKLKFLNEGLFREWFDQLEGTSFDTQTAANVFFKMVKDEPNIDLMMNVSEMQPVVEANDSMLKVSGLDVVGQDNSKTRIRAKIVIDATQDADIAAAAGAPYMTGREDLGDKEAKTAVTLVIKIKGITDEVWTAFGKRKGSGQFGTTIWGFPEAAEYVASDPDRVRVRSLNIGRQADGTALINAMMVFGVDPLDPNSRKEGYEIGKQEAPRFIDYMKQTVKEFEAVEYAGVAEELYVRESRHIVGEYVLSIRDLMENRDHYDAIAYGSYQVDLHSTGSKDAGYVLMKPMQYGVPFRSLVPLKVDDLLVVGRSASFQSMAHGSARVVPLGMATGQAAGAAAAMSIQDGVTVREMSKSQEYMDKLRSLLTEQGVDLKMNKLSTPYYLKHKATRGLLTAIGLLITTGGYNNEGFKLDEPSNPMRFAGHIPKLRKAVPDKFAGDAAASMQDLTEEEMKSIPLSMERAIHILSASMGLDQHKGTVEHFVDQKWLAGETLAAIDDWTSLTNGEVYLIIDDVLRNYANYSEYGSSAPSTSGTDTRQVTSNDI